MMGDARKPFNELIGTGYYRDTGCDLAPSCLRCPFERCRYDEPGGIPGALRQERNEQVRAALAEAQPHTHEENARVAARFGLSVRSAYRIARS